MHILITAAGGMTGERLLTVLGDSSDEIRVRAAVTSSRRAEALTSMGAEVVCGDLRRPEFRQEVLAGIDAVYAIWPNFDPDEYSGMSGLIDDAGSSQRRFVLHSVLRPHIAAMPHHWAKMRVEEHLYTSSMSYRILQPGIYMDNLAGWLPAAEKSGRIEFPWGVSPAMSYVDLWDIAHAGSILLREEGHDAATYEACGPRRLQGEETARILGALLGRPLESVDGHPPVWRRGETYAQKCWRLMLEYYAQFGFPGSPVSLEALLGRSPRDLQEWRPFIGV